MVNKRELKKVTKEDGTSTNRKEISNVFNDFFFCKVGESLASKIGVPCNYTETQRPTMIESSL